MDEICGSCNGRPPFGYPTCFDCETTRWMPILTWLSVTVVCIGFTVYTGFKYFDVEPWQIVTSWSAGTLGFLGLLWVVAELYNAYIKTRLKPDEEEEE